MHLSITSVATNRSLLAVLLAAELIAGALLMLPAAPDVRPALAAPAPLAAAVPAVTGLTLVGGRSAELVGLGGETSNALLVRIAAELDGAVAAVSGFWGTDWPREIVIVATSDDEQFRLLGRSSADTAAVNIDGRIVFAAGAAAMSAADLRLVVRHELFHYATRAATAADAPLWLSEGVADYVARPRAPRPAPAVLDATLPNAAELSTPGPDRSLAYDRAWYFASFVADEYGGPALRQLYLRACGPGHPDVAIAIRETLGDELEVVLTHWQRWLSG